MASRRERKDRARAARMAAERADAERAARVRRVRLLAGVVAVAVIAAAIGIVISIGGGSSPAGLAHGRASDRLVSRVDAALHGIPEHGTELGRPGAPVTLTMFGDLQCPICAALADGTDGSGLPQFIQDQVRPGHARLIYRSFCTATCDAFPVSRFDEQQTAAGAAGLQGRFWYYEELFYRQQGAEGTPYMTPAFLDRLARQVPGLRVGEWSRDRADPRLAARVIADGHAALRELPVINGGRGTPGLIMSGPLGTRFVAEGIVTYPQLVAALRAVA